MTAPRYTVPAAQLLAQCRQAEQQAREACKLAIDCGAVWVPGSDEFVFAPEQYAEYERRRLESGGLGAVFRV